MDASRALRVAVTAGLPVAATALGTALGTEAPELDVDDVRMAKVHRVQGLVWHALNTGVVVADSNVTELARDAQLAALRTCLVAEETGARALELLAAAGVDARALKGIAIAHLDHPNPAERVFGDADVLVRPSDLALALRALGGAEFERVEPPVRGWWERRFGKAVVLRAPNGGELDLHIRIAAGFFGERIGHDILWEGRNDFDLAGRSMSALDPEGRLLQACAHAVVGGGSGLRALRDIAQLVLVSNVDWPGVAAAARNGGYDGLVSTAIESTWTRLRLNMHHPAMSWAQGLNVPSDQSAAIKASSTPGLVWSIEGLGALPAYGWMDRARFLGALAVPSRASLRIRGRTRFQHARRLLRSRRGGS